MPLAAEQRHALRLTYGFAVAERLPDEARRAFDEVAHDKSAKGRTAAQALYGLGMRSSPNRPREAIHYFTQAIEADPNLIEAVRFRGILWARCGDFEAAGKDINTCLVREPNAGGSLYAAACITALAAKKFSGATRAKLCAKAIELLQQAFDRGYGKDKVAEDPDLTVLRGLPEFRRLVEQKSETRNQKSEIRSQK